MIEQYFDKYPGSLISLNHVAGLKTIHFWMKKDWIVPEDLSDRIGLRHERQSVDKNDPTKYYCIAYQNFPEAANEQVQVMTYDELFDAVSYIFDHNIEREHKEALLQAKIKQLQDQFANLTLDELQKMDFK